MCASWYLKFITHLYWYCDNVCYCYWLLVLALLLAWYIGTGISLLLATTLSWYWHWCIVAHWYSDPTTVVLAAHHNSFVASLWQSVRADKLFTAEPTFSVRPTRVAGSRWQISISRASNLAGEWKRRKLMSGFIAKNSQAAILCIHGKAQGKDMICILCWRIHSV